VLGELDLDLVGHDEDVGVALEWGDGDRELQDALLAGVTDPGDEAVQRLGHLVVGGAAGLLAEEVRERADHRPQVLVGCGLVGGGLRHWTCSWVVSVDRGGMRAVAAYKRAGLPEFLPVVSSDVTQSAVGMISPSRQALR
jgi:hypothetical protein